MASFTRFRPDTAAKMTTSEVDSAEAWFEDHLNYARNVLLGVINKESKVGGPIYELSATSKSEITASVDWNYGGYYASFTFKGRFRPDEEIIARGRLKAITGIYHYDGMQTGIAMDKIKGIKIDTLILNDIDRKLLSKLYLFSYFLEQSALLNEPHHLANYLYEISNLFNQFYESEKILEIDDSAHLSSKIYITNLFLTTSQNVMWCLGINPVSEM